MSTTFSPGLVPRERAEQLRAHARQIWSKGSVFIKHDYRAKGKCSKRFVRVVAPNSKDGKLVYGDVKGNKVKEVLLIDIHNVLSGARTTVLKALRNSGTERTVFSIVTKSRTLDLELERPNPLERDGFVWALLCLLDQPVIFSNSPRSQHITQHHLSQEHLGVGSELCAVLKPPEHVESELLARELAGYSPIDDTPGAAGASSRRRRKSAGPPSRPAAAHAYGNYPHAASTAVATDASASSRPTASKRASMPAAAAPAHLGQATLPQASGTFPASTSSQPRLPAAVRSSTTPGGPHVAGEPGEFVPESPDQFTTGSSLLLAAQQEASAAAGGFGVDDEPSVRLTDVEQSFQAAALLSDQRQQQQQQLGSASAAEAASDAAVASAASREPGAVVLNCGDERKEGESEFPQGEGEPSAAATGSAAAAADEEDEDEDDDDDVDDDDASSMSDEPGSAPTTPPAKKRSAAAAAASGSEMSAAEFATLVASPVVDTRPFSRKHSPWGDVKLQARPVVHRPVVASSKPPPTTRGGGNGGVTILRKTAKSMSASRGGGAKIAAASAGQTDSEPPTVVQWRANLRPASSRPVAAARRAPKNVSGAAVPTPAVASSPSVPASPALEQDAPEAVVEAIVAQEGVGGPSPSPDPSAQEEEAPVLQSEDAVATEPTAPVEPERQTVCEDTPAAELETPQQPPAAEQTPQEQPPSAAPATVVSSRAPPQQHKRRLAPTTTRTPSSSLSSTPTGPTAQQPAAASDKMSMQQQVKRNKLSSAQQRHVRRGDLEAGGRIRKKLTPLERAKMERERFGAAPRRAHG